MAYKAVVSLVVLVLAITSDGFKLAAVKETPCNPAYGGLISPTICNLVTGVVGGLADPLSIQDITIKDLHLIDPNLKGHINLWNVTVSGVAEILIAACSMATETAEAPLAVKLDIAVPHIVLEASYEMNALLASLIPIYGEGDLRLTLELDLAVETNITFCPYENPMVMEVADYLLGLRTPLDIEMSGLLDGASFVEEIIKKIEDPHTFEIIEKQIHPVITEAVPGIANPLLQNFTPCQFLGC